MSTKKVLSKADTSDTIDYEKEWEKVYRQRQKDIRTGNDNHQYWDKVAEEYSNSVVKNGFAPGKKTLYALRELITPESEVLEIGSGPGTLIIPLAEKVKRAVAIEPSSGMARCLARNAKAHKLKNLEIVGKRWQDVNIRDIEGSFDLVVSSSVMWQFKDLWKQIRKMEKASRGYCCLVEHVGCNRELSSIWPRIMGDKRKNQISSHQNVQNIMYGVLYQHERYCNVKVVCYDNKTTRDALEKSLKTFINSYRPMNPKVEKLVENEVERLTQGRDHYKRPAKIAVMWWRPPHQDND